MTQNAKKSASAPNESPPLRYVIMHIPGPAWVQGLDPTQQKGVAEHSAYISRLFSEGKIEASGPFLKDNAGGMILTAAGIDAAEAERMGTDDPAIRTGLIRYEVRPWLTVFRQK